MIVRVAIDLSLDRLFDYEVPEGLEGKLAVGQLLSVPFGHREARGFAMEVGERGTGNGERRFSLKPVKAIVDETPFFSPSLLKLVRQIAEYTASPIESVLRAAIPAAVSRPGARSREQVFVEPALAPCEVELTKRQRWLYDNIVRLGGGWMQQLCRGLGTPAARLKALGRLGLVSVAARQRRRDPLGSRRILPSKPLRLNDEQSAALKAILSMRPRGEGGPGALLLHGVTGSGKTEVYLQAIAAELEAGRGAIVMVPEIALTPQTVQRFASRFGGCVAVLHSALSDGERYDEWHRIRSGEARVVIGPRSAVFSPVASLGLVVVDEEHETSYKQEETPRYNARDVAVMRGAIEGAKVVLGSATPSLETWANVARGKYAVASMAKRAGMGRLPAVSIVDMEEDRRGAAEGQGGAIFSRRLLDAIGARLDRAEQTMLFLNRRGFSRSVVCGACGHVLACPGCSMAYTYHRADSCCRCHICGGWIPVPEACPACGSKSLSYKGIGTQRAEAALAKMFPRARVLRMDADSTSRKNSHDDILGAFRRHEADILVGTQMIAKGLDFPNVTLVGVINADSSLNMPDFRAGERTYQLLSQVAGRAGRAELPGEVFIQTRDPSSSVIRAAARGDFAAFAKEEMAVRKELGFPPFCHLSAVGMASRDMKLVADWAAMYARSLGKVEGLDVGDATPSAIEKADGWYRWQIVVRAKSVALTVRAWRWICAARPAPKELRAVLDVDAFSLM